MKGGRTIGGARSGRITVLGATARIFPGRRKAGGQRRAIVVVGDTIAGQNHATVFGRSDAGEFNRRIGSTGPGVLNINWAAAGDAAAESRNAADNGGPRDMADNQIGGRPGIAEIPNRKPRGPIAAVGLIDLRPIGERMGDVIRSMDNGNPDIIGGRAGRCAEGGPAAGGRPFRAGIDKGDSHWTVR